MSKYKIAVGTQEMFRVVIGMFEKLGFKNTLDDRFCHYLFAHNGKVFGDNNYEFFIRHPNKWLTLGDLRALVEPTQKEYLQKLEDGTCKLVVMSDVVDGHEGLIEVPEGADICIDLISENEPSFYRYDFKEVFGCFSKMWLPTTYTDENLTIWNGCKVLWKREKEVGIYTATGADLDAIGEELGANPRLPWISEDKYREHLLRIDGTGLKHVEVECVVVDGELNIEGTAFGGDIDFILADGYVNAFDTQVGGSHYKDLAIQPMEYALNNKLDYAQANVVKYVTRHAAKGGKEDLLKAKHNIDLMIEFYYGEEK